MRYVEARLDEFDRDEAYRLYVTRSLQLAPQGKNIVPTYMEVLEPKKVDVRSGDEIVVDIMSRAGLSFGD